MFSVFVWSYETGRVKKLSGRVQHEGHSSKWRALRNFSFQPCVSVGTRSCSSGNPQIHDFAY